MMRVTPLGLRLAGLAQRLGLVRGVRLIENHLAADSEHNQNFQVRARVIRELPRSLGAPVAKRLESRLAGRSPTYRQLMVLGPIKALSVHMEEMTFLDLYGRHWLATYGDPQSKARQDGAPLVLTPFAFLRPIADPHHEIMPADVRLAQQPWRWNAPLSPHAWTPFFYYLVYVIRQLRASWHPPPRSSEAPQKGRAAAAICWSLKDPETTRNLAWWRQSGIEPGAVLALFDRPDIQPTSDHVAALSRFGIKSVALRTGATADHPELLLKRHPFTARQMLVKLFGVMGRALLMPFRSPMTRLVDPMGELTRLRAEEVKGALLALNIKALFHYREVGEDFHTLAAEQLDAIRFGFHWSCIDGPCVSTMRTHHVFFTWGRHDAETCLAGGSSASVMLLSGSPFMDHPNERHRQSAQEAARAMRRAGASCIVALFDNSTVTRFFYRFFLQWALEDPRLGLLIKSKDQCWGAVARDGLEGLVENAVATGRVQVMDHEALPSDAASASDFAVGITSLSAVALAALTGCRILYVDYERLDQTELAPYATFHKLGPDRCVFYCLEHLKAALAAYLDAPESNPTLGDAAPALAHIDPFRDGKAGVRIGGFVRDYMAALDQGLNRETALNRCVDLYAGRWGDWSVVRRPETGQGQGTC